jgi:uncharacterized lipoprotein YddW (UPF0748 family)
MKLFFLFFLKLSGLILLLGFAFEADGQEQAPRHEFRAAWIATVDNIDWPSKKGLPSDSQRAEFVRMLDMHRANGMNAVIMQIRPAADAFFPSGFEPWSEWLTGVQGTPPRPYYDPLAFMIDEVHKRGMEFHAWLNPYRAQFNIGKSSIAPTHITRVHPEWFLDYGDKRYFDPSSPAVQDFVSSIVSDIVQRYPVDAIHFDDYFYPYRISGKSFPDTAGYRKVGGNMTLDNWRRSNVDSIIVKLYRAIKKENPRCQFGISPFGVWRNQDKDPRGSASRAGQTNYDDLYADILLWLEKGWIDYVAPQLYWEFTQPNAPFLPLLEWWSRNTYGKACYIGLGYYKANTSAAWRDKTLMPKMIRAIRNTPNVHGQIYFSSRSFEKNPLGWNDSLQQNFYRYPALIPPMAWMPGDIPPSPELIQASGSTGGRMYFRVAMPVQFEEGVRQLGVYIQTETGKGFETSKLWRTEPATDTVHLQLDFPSEQEDVQLFFTSISYVNKESDPRLQPGAMVRFRRERNGQWRRVDSKP